MTSSTQWGGKGQCWDPAGHYNTYYCFSDSFFGAIQGELHNICDALPVHIGMCHVPAPMITALRSWWHLYLDVRVAELAGFLDSITICDKVSDDYQNKTLSG